MNAELQKALDKLGVKLAAKEIAGKLPTRAAPQAWRVILTRKIGRGKEAVEVRLTIQAYYPPETGTPLASDVITCLAEETRAMDLSMWDLAQEMGQTRPDAATEAAHNAAKKASQKARRFFGDQWPNVLRVAKGLEWADEPRKRKSA